MSGTSSGKPRRTCSNSVLSAIVCGSELQLTRISTVNVQMRNDAQWIADCQLKLGVSADYDSLGARKPPPLPGRQTSGPRCKASAVLGGLQLVLGIKERDSSAESI